MKVENHLIEIMFGRENTESFGKKSLRSELGGQNSPWRTREIERNIGSSGAVRWLGIG